MLFYIVHCIASAFFPACTFCSRHLFLLFFILFLLFRRDVCLASGHVPRVPPEAVSHKGPCQRGAVPPGALSHCGQFTHLDPSALGRPKVQSTRGLQGWMTAHTVLERGEPAATARPTTPADPPRKPPQPPLPAHIA